MKTREELIDQFDLNPEDEDEEVLLKKLTWVQRAGKIDGAAGRYPDGDYNTDRTWKGGIGKTIDELEATLGLDDNSVFDLYNDAHSEFITGGDDVDEELGDAGIKELEDEDVVEDEDDD